ncbi:tetratricopeptide repeat protein [Paraburkholderia acidisoli]|nr:tetratricopeptide repeat protein [Paraburkholderia acidisoli]
MSVATTPEVFTPSLQADVLVETGLAHHRAGRIDTASTHYRAALDAQPEHAGALHYLGVIALGRNELDEAATLMDRALAQAPGNAEYLANRGVAAARLGDHAAAAAWQRQALAHAPEFANAHNNLGNALLELNDLEGAAHHYRAARMLEPQSAHFAFNLGRALDKAGRKDEALAQYRAATALDGNDIGTWLQMGRLLRAMARPAEAAPCFEHVLAREPDNVLALFELGYVYDAQHRYEEAIPLYRRAAELKPDGAGVVNNLAFALTALARYDEAEIYYRRALELNPALPESGFQLGMLKLRREDYAGGWPLFENRKTTTVGKPSYPPRPGREWRGEPLKGKRVLICREQGVGDQIQFVRYARELAALGARVDAWVAPELAALAATVPGVTRVLDARPDDKALARRYDYWCDVMSLPSRFAGPPPADTPYMYADVRRARAWRERVTELAPNARRRIGLVWAGNPRHHFDAFRSVPLTALKPLAALDGNGWFAIQKGPGAAQLPDVAPAWPLHAIGDELHDFAATAALIDSLDLVITVDTSVAHLAGALGKPVWVLLAAQPDWRWGKDRRDSAWYPSARVFRQTTLGDWSGVVAELRDALRDDLRAALGGA